MEKSPQDMEVVEQAAAKAIERIDKRKLSSKANLEKARQAKLEMLRNQRELQKNNRLQKIDETATQMKIPIRRLESDESESDDTEEEIIYVNPAPKKQKRDTSEIDEIKKMISDMMIQKHEAEKKEIEPPIVVPRSEPIPIPEPPKAIPKESTRKDYVWDPIIGAMRTKILNF